MNSIPVETVLRGGYCTPNCLLALDEESGKCDCRCHGAYHGALADHQVIAQRTAWNWYELSDVVYLNKNEYASIAKGLNCYADYNRAYRESYGRFQCVVHELDDTYSVVFDYYNHGVEAYDLKRWDKLCKWVDLLLISRTVSGCTYPTNPDHEIVDGSRCYFEFRAWGIKDKNSAIVIQDTVSNYVYACDWDNRLEIYIKNLENYLSISGIKYTLPETHLTDEQLQRIQIGEHCDWEAIPATDVPIIAPRSKGKFCHDTSL